ncbi:Transposon Ty3-I Gag-Pol [Paramuricea clavata]|uniref:Transposon Ty3-I Gag-Pol n=1 Tax=Paramuricea clavata TaxID=317549 RepID=A0A6S7KMW6_PARCT|nr:Transposon Ty3-I Gag-Pol [Paramuricea clavata]
MYSTLVVKSLMNLSIPRYIQRYTTIYNDIQRYRVEKTCKSYEFGDLQDSQVRDGIVCGIQSAEVKARLLRGPAQGISIGYEDHELRNCPANGQMCHECQGRNHFARVCRSSGKPAHVVEESSDSEKEMYIVTVERRIRRMDGIRNVVVKVGKRDIALKLDTGAQCNVIPYETYKRMTKEKPVKSKTKLVSYSGHSIKVIGKSTVPLEHKGKFYPVELQIAEKSDVVPVLGLQTCLELNLIKRLFAVNDTSDETVVVEKNNGKVRVCLDPRDLNKAVLRDHYPMRTIEEVAAELNGAKVFSTIDASSGFWQVKLHAESSKLVTFNSPLGRYKFLRLPFGINSAPEVFQRRMTQALEDIEGVAVIVDDILVWGTALEEQKLNKEKSKIQTSELSYTGHLLTRHGVKPDPHKVNAIKEINTPEDKKEL